MAGAACMHHEALVPVPAPGLSPGQELETGGQLGLSGGCRSPTSWVLRCTHSVLAFLQAQLALLGQWGAAGPPCPTAQVRRAVRTAYSLQHTGCSPLLGSHRSRCRFLRWRGRCLSLSRRGWCYCWCCRGPRERGSRRGSLQGWQDVSQPGIVTSVDITRLGQVEQKASGAMGGSPMPEPAGTRSPGSQTCNKHPFRIYIEENGHLDTLRNLHVKTVWPSG